MPRALCFWRRCVCQRWPASSVLLQRRRVHTDERRFEAAPFSPWVLQTNSGAVANLSADAGQAGAQSAIITIGEAGVFEWDVQLAQEDASLIPGKRYKLSFWAKAQAARSASAALQQNDAPYNTLSRQSFQIGTSWQRHSAEFVYPLTALTASPDFRINIGANGGCHHAVARRAAARERLVVAGVLCARVGWSKHQCGVGKQWHCVVAG